jgi:hypothetical protein
MSAARHFLLESTVSEFLENELLEKCAKIAEAGAKQCFEGDTPWHEGFKYAATNTALGIAASIRALKTRDGK